MVAPFLPLKMIYYVPKDDSVPISPETVRRACFQYHESFLSYNVQGCCKVNSEAEFHVVNEHFSGAGMVIRFI